MRRKLLIFMCIAAALLLAVECAQLPEYIRSDEPVAAAPDAATEAAADPEPERESQAEPMPTETETAPQEPEEETTEAPTSPVTEPTVEPTVKPTAPAQTEPAPESISFPYRIPGTTLEIRSIASYDGIFVEDGSDREITDVAAAVICNVGEVPIEYAQVRLGDGQLTFVVTTLDSRSVAVVQEISGANYVNCDWYECSANVAYMAEMEQSDGIVKISENDNGALVVSNISDEMIPCLRIFYKFYMEDQNVYVGGITYNVKILDLDVGQSQTVMPSHYISGYSRIVMVKTYVEEN